MNRRGLPAAAEVAAAAPGVRSQTRGAVLREGAGAAQNVRFGEYELRALAAVVHTRVRFEVCLGRAAPDRDHAHAEPKGGRASRFAAGRRAAAANAPPLLAPISLLVAVIVLTIRSRVVT